MEGNVRQDLRGYDMIRQNSAAKASRRFQSGRREGE